MNRQERIKKLEEELARLKEDRFCCKIDNGDYVKLTWTGLSVSIMVNTHEDTEIILTPETAKAMAARLIELADECDE